MAKTELQVKDDSFATPEAKIKELRKQRDPKLGQIAVNRFDFIDALIAEYDNTLVTLATVKQTLSEVTADRDRIADELRQVSEDRAQFLLNNQSLESIREAAAKRIAELEAELERARPFIPLTQEELHMEHMDKGLPAPNGQND
jgi:uncharacterized coiled-coil DUF342 family protein